MTFIASDGDYWEVWLEEEEGVISCKRLHDEQVFTARVKPELIDFREPNGLLRRDALQDLFEREILPSIGLMVGR